MNPGPSNRLQKGLTLIEVLVSATLIAILLWLLLSVINQTQNIWNRTTSRISQFQSARAAFDSISRRLAQATLNTYWQVFDHADSASLPALSFARRSDLHFLSGPTSAIFSRPALTDFSGDLDRIFPTHSIFFQAPLGITQERNSGEDRPRFRGLDGMLSGVGYFIEFCDELQPAFIRGNKAAFPPKHRFRLKEINVPAEMLTIFRRPPAIPENELSYSNEPLVLEEDPAGMAQLDFTKIYRGLVDENLRMRPSFTRPDWMKIALFRERLDGQPRFRFARTLADNVVALVILPKYAKTERKNEERLDELAPDFAYDSWRILPSPKGGAANLSPQFPARDCLLPPVVQITLIAIDERSAACADAGLENIPAWTQGLFQSVTTEDDLRAQIAKLEERLLRDSCRPDYRIFSTDVVMRGSKWSRAN